MVTFKFYKIFAISICIMILSGCKQTDTIELTGTVESTQIDVNAEVSGQIVKLLKNEGDLVKTGDVIAVINSDLEQLAVNQQNVALKMKKLKLDEILAGSRAEEIRTAELNVNAAKARYDELKNGSRPEQISQAESAVKIAKAKLDEVSEGARPEQISQGEAVVKNATSAVQNAESAVNVANINYGFILEKFNQVNELFKSNTVSQNDFDDAKNKLDVATEQLKSAQAQKASAQAGRDSAQAQLDLLKSGSTKEAIKMAEGNYEQAKSQLALLKKGATEQSIEVAESAYEQAQAQLELLKKGATYQMIETARADVEQGEIAVKREETVLKKYNISALTAGTCTLKNVDVGDIVTVGSSIVTLSDLNDLWANVYIPQKYLGLIKLDEPIDLTSSAVPNQILKGKIISIASNAEFTPKNTETNEAKENIVFKVKIKIDQQYAKDLRPGMTVNTALKTN